MITFQGLPPRLTRGDLAVKNENTMKTNYKYSSLPKAGDRVTIIDAFEGEKFNGRTGIILPKSKTRTAKLVEVYGLGQHMFHFKSLYKL